MPKTTINGIQCHYVTKGTGDDVILLHGLTSTLAVWYTKVFPELARDFRVTAYDLRGHGLSGMTPTGYSSFHLAQDLVALMDTLGIGRARLIGHSFGGAIALHAALLHPDRVDAVVLLDTGVACLRHLRSVENWTGWEEYGDRLKKFGISLKSFIEKDQQNDVSDIIRSSFKIPVQFGFRRGKTRVTPRLRRLLDETSVGTEFRSVAGLTEEKLREIRVPVLALYGAASPYGSIASRLVELLPICQAQMLEESGHFYLMQDPMGVLDRTMDFLRFPGAVGHNASRCAGA